MIFAVVLLVLLIFALENGQRANMSFFGSHVHLPMGVALLLAAVFGVLLVALPGTAASCNYGSWPGGDTGCGKATSAKSQSPDVVR